MRRVVLFTCLTSLTALAALAVACGSSSNNTTATTSPSGGSPAARTPSGVATSAVTQTPGAGGGAPNGTSAPPETIKIAAANITFDKAQLTAQPGAIKIEFDNNDANVAHNFAVYKSASDTSTPLGATPITTGPDKQTLSITLDQGEYYYCRSNLMDRKLASGQVATSWCRLRQVM